MKSGSIARRIYQASSRCYEEMVRMDKFRETIGDLEVMCHDASAQEAASTLYRAAWEIAKIHDAFQDLAYLIQEAEDHLDSMP